ncbi:hypothetical protein F6Y05_01245 (plasmid) [Bacillus megaterium]|nr:hypothetical protein [Priestia megaterium]
MKAVPIQKKYKVIKEMSRNASLSASYVNCEVSEVAIINGGTVRFLLISNVKIEE